jgi:[NiFe] hydrogenase assembly HybE family chaperone
MPLGPRVAQLEAAFEHVAATRMAGVGLLHPALQVQAVGFERLDDAPDLAMGVLLTPWFMNLLRLPLQPDAVSDDGPIAPRGRRRTRRVGAAAIDFIGAEEAPFGRFEACSLFSPVSAFADQAAAVATAQAVLAALRRPVPAALAVDAPARRGFLFGRPAAPAR